MSAPSNPEAQFVPALGKRWLTGIYDPVLALTMREKTFRAALVGRVAALGAPKAVLDLGCGTGSTTVLLAEIFPDAVVSAIDGDEDVLARAREKARRLGVAIKFTKALAGDLPLASKSQDAVVSSLLFHHLTEDAKQAALAEALRVLKPGGSLHIADWGAAQDPLMRAAFLGVQLLDGFETTRLHAAGGLPSLLEASAFSEVHVWRQLRTMFGTLDLIEARCA